MRMRAWTAVPGWRKMTTIESHEHLRYIMAR